jgi:hypothetical protein
MKLSGILFLLLSGCLLGSCAKILDKKNPEAVDEGDVWNDL